MAFSKYTLTNAGRDMMLACMATGDFQISSLVLGSGRCSGDMHKMQAVVSPKISFPADQLRITKGNGQIEIAAQLTNEQLEESFDWREYGVYATDGESTVLYCYDNAGDDPVPILSAASGTAFTSVIKVMLKIDNDATVNISFAPEPDITVDNTVTEDGANPVSGAAVYAFAGAAVLYTEQTLTESQKTQARANIGVSEAAVLYTAQTLTESQKTQARANIGVSEAAVLYTEQTLTEEQKAQARANIGAGDTEIAAANVTAGTFSGDVAAPTTTDMTTPILRNSVITTTDPGAGASVSYPAGTEICVYE